ncbi:MAG: DNA polymerase III subunit gamma/tau, partial [Bacteroidetes bacterium]|nr:DNA polymerase III subunit gamma/tau [Bacteroidota bacterium]
MENHFVVSARKYRPATFDTVVGQEHITTTLKNAITNNQLAQAFLFCGPRGVGKTTCARILAKTINCTQRTADCEPCNECDSCTTFNNNTSFNIYEMDAASNSSVDDIRALVDQVRIPPQGSKYKVYIIDEVHMLSANAFNAFLKTLEEPPPYAIFILATTEKHKIIPTILSRCQIFDFKRIRVADIATHLKYIASKEGISYDEQGLHIIAQKADGALRDALSIFDQTSSFTNQNITYQNVIENLNILDYDYYFKMMDAIAHFSISDTLLLYHDVMSKGFDGHQFVVGLSEHIRNLMVCKDASTITLLEVVEVVGAKYKSQAEGFPGILLLRYLGILNDCDTNYKQARNQRLHVELALMRMAYLSAPKTEDADKKKIADHKVNLIVPTLEEEQAPAPPPIITVMPSSDTLPKPGASGSLKLGSWSGIKESITPLKNEENDNIIMEVHEPSILTPEKAKEIFSLFLKHLSDNGKNAAHFILSRSHCSWDDEKSELKIVIPSDYFQPDEIINYKLDILAFVKKTSMQHIS